LKRSGKLGLPGLGKLRKIEEKTANFINDAIYPCYLFYARYQLSHPLALQYFLDTTCLQFSPTAFSVYDYLGVFTVYWCDSSLGARG
jgi:hypothetical protein